MSLLQIAIPPQVKKDIDIDIDMLVVATVIGYHRYLDELDAHYWALQSEGLHFSGFPDNFESLVLCKNMENKKFSLEVSYQCRNINTGEIEIESVLLDVSSVQEVQSFPSVLQ